MIDIGDLKWIAGFLEGEGSFSVNGREGKRGKTVRVQASQMRKWPLEKLNSFLPGRIHPVYAKSKPWGDKQYWLWDLDVKNSICLMMTIYILMSPYRQQQIRRCISVWRGQQTRRTWNTKSPFYHPFCKNGHRIDDMNLYVTPSTGQKECKICKATRSHVQYLKRRDSPNCKQKQHETYLKWKEENHEKYVRGYKLRNKIISNKRKLAREKEKLCTL